MRLIAGLVMLAAVAAPAAAQSKGDEIKWSVSGGAALPMGDFSKSYSTGFGVGLSGEWKLNSDWGLRGDLSYDNFSGKTVGTTKIASVGMSSLGVSFVNRPDPKFSWSVGAGYYMPSCSGCKSNAGVSLMGAYNIDPMWAIEAGYVNVFTSGSNSNWIPVRVRYSF